MIYADASFVVALFVKGDEHWQAAWQWWKNHHSQTLIVSRLTIFEAENTIRVLPLGGKLRQSESRAALEGIQRALLEGVLVRRSVPEQRLYPLARRLSTHHTARSSYGALDILHVASVLELGADMFLSFDKNQCVLAKAEGLKVGP